MFAGLMATLAVIIAVQALRQASRDQIVIQVMPESLSSQQGPALPTFLQQPGPTRLTSSSLRQPEQPLELFPVRRSLPIPADQLEPPLAARPPLPMLQRALQPVPMDVHRN